MFGFHPIYLVVLVIIVLIIFGPGRLPELGGAIGKGLREFRKATSDLTNEITRSGDEDRGATATTVTTAAPPAPAAPAVAPSPAATEPVKPVEPGTEKKS